MATNHFSQKSIKEPAKKHFPLNYLTQIVPDSTHVFAVAVYLQHDSGAWLKPSFPRKLDWERNFPTLLVSSHGWLSWFFAALFLDPHPYPSTPTSHPG